MRVLQQLRPKERFLLCFKLGAQGKQVQSLLFLYMFT